MYVALFIAIPIAVSTLKLLDFSSLPPYLRKPSFLTSDRSHQKRPPASYHIVAFVRVSSFPHSLRRLRSRSLDFAMDQLPTSGSCENAALLSIRYKRGHLELLDQRRLPMETLFLEISDSTKGWHAIKDMVVRGAPAIAIAAALSLAVELVNLDPKPTAASEALQYINDRLDYLVSSRPTAVNLYDTVFKLKEQTNRVAAASSNAEAVFNAYVEAAEKMLVVDVTRNMAIGAYGADLILNEAKGQRAGDHLRVLTHCNTGSLATAAYGTALGVIRALHSRGKLETVYCTETRPFNQGSRLTAYELVYDKIPAVLIADSAAAALQSLGKIDVVVVGADRIAANGDTANKIGTYNLALSSFHHGIPFYVAAPLTSIDISLSSGETIVIEERPSTELTHAQGGAGSQVAASGVSVWNPAFDITPAKLITAIITDEGIITKYQGSLNFDIHAFCHEHDALGHAITNSGFCKTNTSGSHLSNGCKSDNDVHGKRKGFYILDAKTVVEYIRNNSKLAERLGGISTDWIVKEVGDGNLNFVYIVVGPNGSFVLKQSVPYVRCVGESWPMSSDRSYYESLALKQHGSLCPEHVPEVYHFDRGMATIIMRYLEPPHIILRKGLIEGIVYPLLADHMSEYMARTLFQTSLLAISTKTHRSSVAEFCGNVELCRLTEQVIFTDPYMEASNNRWTSPQLDQDVKDLHEDKVIKVEIAGLKAKFCERSQSLIHGDLHTGSIMVTASSTQVIDPEFSFYGPIGFDVGAFLGNLVLAYFSQDGHAEYDNDRQEYKKWILSTIRETWNAFEHKFLSMWTASWGSPGDAYPAEVYKTTSEKLLAQRQFMKEIFEDSLGFAAAKIVRRIVGIAHVEDFESIQNPDRRSECEQQALRSAKMILKERRTLSSIEQVIELISQKL